MLLAAVYNTEYCLCYFLHNVLLIIKFKVGTCNLVTVKIFVEIPIIKSNGCMYHLQPNGFGLHGKQFGKFGLYLLFLSIFLYDKLY